MNAIKTCVIIGIVVTTFQGRFGLELFTQIHVDNNSPFVISMYIPFVEVDGAIWPDVGYSLTK
jgi:hypothetical protein